MIACACLGPMYGEQHCPCTMNRLRLPLNTVARAAEQKRAKESLEKLFAEGGKFYRLAPPQPKEGKP